MTAIENLIMQIERTNDQIRELDASYQQCELGSFECMRIERALDRLEARWNDLQIELSALEDRE